MSQEIIPAIVLWETLSLISRRKLPNISAVYCLRDNTELLYIGETAWLKSRAYEHAAIHRYKNSEKTIMIAWFPIHGTHERKTLEYFLLQNHNTLYNKKLTYTNGTTHRKRKYMGAK